MKRKLFIILAAMVVLIQACAGLDRHKATEKLPRDQKALAFFVELDRVTQKYKVADASRFPISGFPYLRTDRFLEGMKDKLIGPEQEHLWIEWMQKLDLQSREKEIANLPKAALLELAEQTGEPPDREAVYEQIRVYSNHLFSSDRRYPEYAAAVKKAVFVPDEYSTIRRILGLYPVAVIPVSIATNKANTRYKHWHQIPPEELETYGRLTTFVPPKATKSFNHVEINRLFDSQNHDAFGLPLLTQEDIVKLAHMFAPVITQDVNAEYDRFGRVFWDKHQVTIDPKLVTVYYYISYVFVDGIPATQMNYAIWYSGRMGDNSPWIERGPLDGLTLRITFDSIGRPVMADVMNNCGCYYFFIPNKKYVREVIEKPNDFEPLIPTWLPDEFPWKRIHLRVNSGWHQVQHIHAGDIPDETIIYELLPYDVLKSLPQEDGLKESVFTPDGIMKNSSRIEPYILFSMGIPNVGYMRQRGHHAIKLVGREHFTNPYIYDKNFVFIRE